MLAGMREGGNDDRINTEPTAEDDSFSKVCILRSPGLQRAAVPSYCHRITGIIGHNIVMCHLPTCRRLCECYFALVLPLLLFLHEGSCSEQYCESPTDCIMIQGSTCVDKRCTCETSSDTGLFQPCQTRRNSYGDNCEFDRNCNDRDSNLICARDHKICKCKRGLTWDVVSTRCHTLEDDNPFMRDLGEKFDPTRDIIIPSVILMTLAATAWLCFKLFCNCGKTLRRRRRATDMTRALEEAQIPGVVPSQSTTWVASYRVFGPMNSVDSRNFPPCLLLPAGPPPYEEALKHKVILSSYTAPPMSAQHVDHAQL